MIGEFGWEKNAFCVLHFMRSTNYIATPRSEYLYSLALVSLHDGYEGGLENIRPLAAELRGSPPTRHHALGGSFPHVGWQTHELTSVIFYIDSFTKALPSFFLGPCPISPELCHGMDRRNR